MGLLAADSKPRVHCPSNLQESPMDSISYMALTVRAANHPVDLMDQGEL